MKTAAHSQPSIASMKLQQVSPSCYAVVSEKNRVCDANSGSSTSVAGP
jgi:hypothetical protein